MSEELKIIKQYFSKNTLSHACKNNGILLVNSIEKHLEKQKNSVTTCINISKDKDKSINELKNNLKNKEIIMMNKMSEMNNIIDQLKRNNNQLQNQNNFLLSQGKSCIDDLILQLSNCTNENNILQNRILCIENIINLYINEPVEKEIKYENFKKNLLIYHQQTTNIINSINEINHTQDLKRKRIE